MPLSQFHPAIRSWFTERLGAPSTPQRDGWPLIPEGRHTLIAAPPGTGKTLAAFLWAIDDLFRLGPSLDDATRVLCVSPLKALGNDVQKNLEGPARRDPRDRSDFPGNLTTLYQYRFPLLGDKRTS